MAKKSARSKGYRSYKQTVTGYTDTEKKIMIIGAAVIVLALILVLAVPKIIESTYLLKVKDGVVQGVEDTWLIKNVGNSSSAKYRKIAEAEPADGYVLSRSEEGFVDKQEAYRYYTPEAENAAVKEYYAYAGNGSYDELATNALSSLSSFTTEVLYSSDIQHLDIDGKHVHAFILEYTLDTAAEGEEPNLEYHQCVNYYVESPISDYCVLFSATSSGADETAFQDHAAVQEVLNSAVANLKLEG